MFVLMFVCGIITELKFSTRKETFIHIRLVYWLDHLLQYCIKRKHDDETTISISPNNVDNGEVVILLE